ncbi:MAG: PIG-L family deacetylase [Actinomycetota bacterium]
MKKGLVIGGLLVLVLIAGAFIAWRYVTKVTGIPTVPAKESKIAVNEDDRILIIAPHPDDETLGPGGLAQQATAAGAAVKAIVITTGDGYKHAVQVNLKVNEPKPEDYRALAEMRHKESVAAMAALGVKDVVFLGYADGSLNSLWRESWDYDQLHTGLNGGNTGPYDFAYEPGAPYCGENLVKNLSSLMMEYKPTIIVYPTPEDLHHDHWAANAFTQYVIARDNVTTREYTYLVHRGKLWPSPPVYEPEKVMDPPYQMGEEDANWLRHTVTGEERVAKLEAIEQYKTQLPLADQFLKAFVRRNELYAIYPELTLSEVASLSDGSEGSAIPGTIINDYEASELSKSLGGVGDIRRIAAVTDDKNVDMIVELEKPLQAGTVLMINLRVFTPGGVVRRLDIRVNRGQAVAIKAAKNSVQPQVDLTLSQKDKRIRVRVSASIFDGASQVMFNTDTFRDTATEDEWLDRTAWRRLSLQ